MPFRRKCAGFFRAYEKKAFLLTVETFPVEFTNRHFVR